MSRASCRWVGCAGILLVGCATFPSTPNPPPGPQLLGPEVMDTVRRTAKKEGLAPASAEDQAAVDACSVIDVHAHSFNARYLPIRNILLGKRDATPLATFLPDDWAKKIAAAIASATELAPVPGVDERLDPIESSNLVSLGSRRGSRSDDPGGEVATVQAIGESVRSRYLDLESSAATPTESTGGRLDAVESVVREQLGFDELDALEWALGKLQDLGDFPSFSHFLVTLLTRDDDQMPRFHEDFGGPAGGPDSSGGVQLAVSHMMDLGPVYGQRADSVLLEPFSLGQVPRMAHFQRQPGARMIYFVAYNPFRDNNAQGGTAMEIVEGAIENNGAWGVKVYPPSGYRPARNAIPSRPGSYFSKEPGKQWDSRYEGVTASRLDLRLDALFAYCSAGGIPIFTHCSPGEFEARKGYSVHMADPRWWRPVLEKYPNLRLCFGHAGGNRFWYDTGDDIEAWGRLVYELCVRYENVYCEFGVHAELLEPDAKRYFVHLLNYLIENPQGEFPFEEKILYGSDWYMPRKVRDQRDFLQAYKDAFKDTRLFEYADRFFWQNALRYLDVDARLGQADSTIPPTVRDLLGSFPPVE